MMTRRCIRFVLWFTVLAVVNGDLKRMFKHYQPEVVVLAKASSDHEHEIEFLFNPSKSPKEEFRSYTVLNGRGDLSKHSEIDFNTYRFENGFTYIKTGVKLSDLTNGGLSTVPHLGQDVCQAMVWVNRGKHPDQRTAVKGCFGTKTSWFGELFPYLDSMYSNNAFFPGVSKPFTFDTEENRHQNFDVYSQLMYGARAFLITITTGGGVVIRNPDRYLEDIMPDFVKFLRNYPTEMIVFLCDTGEQEIPSGAYNEILERFQGFADGMIYDEGIFTQYIRWKEMLRTGKRIAILAHSDSYKWQVNEKLRFGILYPALENTSSQVDAFVSIKDDTYKVVVLNTSEADYNDKAHITRRQRYIEFMWDFSKAKPESMQYEGDLRYFIISDFFTGSANVEYCIRKNTYAGMKFNQRHNRNLRSSGQYMIQPLSIELPMVDERKMS